MPENPKSRFDLLHDIDLSKLKKGSKQLDVLVKTIQKSTLSEHASPSLKTSVLFSDKTELHKKLERLKSEELPENLTDYEVEKISGPISSTDFSKSFTLNHIFTIPEKILGPFPTIDGAELFYKFYRTIDDFKIFFNGQSAAALIIPVRVARLILNSSVNSLILTKGNVWIRADLMDPSAPKTHYIGLKITKGNITLDKKYAISNNSITINPANAMGLDFTLDHSYQAEPTEKIGMDGFLSECKPTDILKLQYSHGRITVTDTDAFFGKTLGWKNYFRRKKDLFLWDDEKKQMLLELTSEENIFKIHQLESTFYNIEGEAKIRSSFWVLPSRILQQNQSVEVKFNGALQIDILKGLSTVWNGIHEKENRVLIRKGKIYFLNGIFSLETQSADFQLIREQFTLWQKSEEKPYKMELEVSFRNYGFLQMTSISNVTETVAANADTDFLIDKPLYADNTPVHPTSKKSIYGKVLTQNGTNLILLDQDMLTENDTENIEFSIPKDKSRYQFALENAYFTTSKETGLFLNAKCDDRNHLFEGKLLFTYLILDILPTLPHPYTGTMLPRYKRGSSLAVSTRNSIGIFLANIDWKTDNDFTSADVTFKMSQKYFAAKGITYPENKNDLRRKQPHPDRERKAQEAFALLDVSTESDHWGISLSFYNQDVLNKIHHSSFSVDNENVVTIERNYLQAPMGLLHGITLPQVSWEPVFNQSPPNPPDNPDPKIGILVQKNNNIPTVFSQLDKNYVKISPKDYMERFKENLRPSENAEVSETSYSLQSKVLFTLPNGKFAVASLSRFNGESMVNEKHLQFINPKFSFQNLDLNGSLQFRISAEKTANPNIPPKMDGVARQLHNLEYNAFISILGKTVTEIFNSNFYNEGLNSNVPLEFIDFSGYGASTFSDWKNPLAKYASIAQAKFDLLRGRVAHEIVQAVSIIYPWGICTTRTVTFLRNNNAVIYREDSGWVAQSDGLFDFRNRGFKPGNSQNDEPSDFKSLFKIYPGLTEGLFNIRNIQEDYSDVQEFSYKLQNGDYYFDESSWPNVIRTDKAGMPQKAKFVAVYFDADVKLDALNKTVTGKRFKGYLQIKPKGVPIPPKILDELVRRSQNSIGGSIDTTLPIENTLQKFKANRVEVSACYENGNTNAVNFVSSVKGSVILPSEGSWSVVEVDQQSGDVSNIKAGTSVGLVKNGLRDQENPFYNNPNKITNLAFPDSIVNNGNTFFKAYGILQNTNTQKVLFKNLKFDKNTIDQFTSDPALLADCFRLMNSKGPFPKLGDAITMESAQNAVVGLLPDGIKKKLDLEVPDNFNFDILGKENDAFRIYIKYDSSKMDGTDKKPSVINFLTDSELPDKWLNKVHNITIAADLLVFKPLLYISGNFNIAKKQAPSLNTGFGPQLKLHETLQKIYDILEFLSKLDPTQPSEAIKKGLQIAMSNSADSWEYKFKADKEIPIVKFPFDPINYNSPTTPLKMDAFFRLGMYFNQPIKIPNTINQIKPSVGVYLELGADIRVMCVSLAAATIYATGRAEVGLSGDLNSPPTLYFKFGFGVELSVGLPVIGSVAVLYMVGVDMKINSEILVVGAFIYFRGRVEIFGGIVTITISIEAAGKIEKSFIGGPTNCIAMCTFALDISIAFIININFTKTWEETRQIS